MSKTKPPSPPAIQARPPSTPTVPPVYRPQASPRGVRPTAAPSRIPMGRPVPVPPPVFKVVQAKIAAPATPSLVRQGRPAPLVAQKKPLGAPVYRVGSSGRAGSSGMAIQRSSHLTPPSQPEATNLDKFNEVLAKVHSLLSAAKIKYAVQGSMAQAMHGATLLQNPGDIDILVPSPNAALLILVGSGDFKANGGSMLVKKVEHVATGIELDLAQIEDFGMTGAMSSVTEKQGAAVLSLYETVKSLLLRAEKRKKDGVALSSLLRQRGNELTEKEKNDIVSKMGAPDWDTLQKSLPK